MSYLIKFSAFLFILFSFFWFNSVNSSWWWDSNPDNPYCNSWDCWLEEWVEALKNWLNWSAVETDTKLSDYIQDIVLYILTFVSIIAVLYIIWSWFNLLISWWDEDKVKKTKWIITYVIIWIVVMWLAYPITTFIIQVVGSSWT